MGDVDPGELEVLPRKDGAFWHYINPMFSRVCVERGSSGILGVVAAAYLLVGCGGVEPSLEAEALGQQAARVEDGGYNCRVECWDGPSASYPTQGNFVTRIECERFAMAYCDADHYAGGYWWRGEFWAW